SYCALSGPIMSPFDVRGSGAVVGSRSCWLIVDDADGGEGRVADDTGVPFLRGDRAGAFGDAAHGVQGGGHGLEVVAGHRVRVLPLPVRASLDPGHDQREAEAEPEVVVRALDLVGDRAEHGAGDAGER